jgi:hypothetical protein
MSRSNSHYSSVFTPFDDIQVEDNDRGITADERDEIGLVSAWREMCLSDFDDDDHDELVAVFGPDDEDNYLGHSHEEGEDEG